MHLTVEFSEETGAALKHRAEAAGLSVEDVVLQILIRHLEDDSSRPSETPLRSISEEILARVHALPDEVFEGLPADGASQHDHYIYGTPKQDDL